MNTQSNVAKNEGRKYGLARKILKIAAISLVAVFLLYEITYSVWKSSGSNEWTLARDEDGIKVWTLKTPGSSLLKVKGHMRTETRLASIIALLEETEEIDESVGIKEFNVLEERELPSLYLTYHHYKQELPFPIGPREAILQIHHAQDPVSKAVEVNVMAAPNKLPPNENFVRFTHLHNIWNLRPLPNGEVDVQLVLDVDFGGNLPYFFKNIITKEALNEMFKSIRSKLTEDRYVNATVAHIDELGEQG